VSAGRPERDYYYDLPLEEIRRGLALTPLERLQRLDELRRFVIMLREAPTVHPQASESAPAPYAPAKPSD
jgi:hypothetical protein